MIDVCVECSFVICNGCSKIIGKITTYVIDGIVPWMSATYYEFVRWICSDWGDPCP